MDTPSPKPTKSWDRLASQARAAASPADLDIRAALRASLARESQPMAAARPSSLWEELVALLDATWLRAGLAACAVAGTLACWQAIGAFHELVAFWSVEGPFAG